MPSGFVPRHLHCTTNGLDCKGLYGVFLEFFRLSPVLIGV